MPLNTPSGLLSSIPRISQQARRVSQAIQRRLLTAGRRGWLRTKGVRFAPPNFIFFCSAENSSQMTVIDVGCGSEAEFSTHMLVKYGAKCFGVDPTQKHRRALLDLAYRYLDFSYIPRAVCANNGDLKFFESKVNESGSIMTDHTNVVTDETISYPVKGLTPRSLLDHIGLDSADILKLDIEGAEYRLLKTLPKDELLPFRQIFVEFHHHAVERYTYADTQKAVETVCEMGFENYSIDGHNYLFRRLN